MTNHTGHYGQFLDSRRGRIERNTAVSEKVEEEIWKHGWRSAGWQGKGLVFPKKQR